MASLLLAGCAQDRGERGAAAIAAPATADTTGGWIGKTAEGFSLPGIDGKVVDVGKVLGTRPVVLVFYRGVW
jgi:hypothetical protein